ncbi:MAG: DUF4185 domain-containing protein [Prosthecobacter sp.]
MKFILGIAAMMAAGMLSAAPVKIFFDTDMETDCDDAGAMAVLHSLADLGECEILATVTSVRDLNSIATVDAINRHRGRPDLPLGMVKGAGVLEQSKFAARIASEFPHRVKSADGVPDAVQVYREVLEEQPDHSVVVVTVGYLTNLKNLLQSPGGTDLIQRKVARWVCMGGNFIGSPPRDDLKLGNVNFQRDATSAHHVIQHWPGEIVFAGREVCSVPSGLSIGESLAQTPPGNPVRRAYEHYFGGKAKNRHVADLATVLYAVRGLTDCWDISAPGRMELAPGMTFDWQFTSEGRQRYLRKKPDNDRHVEGVLNALLIQAAKTDATVAPYPPSPVIQGITFHDETERLLAPGSDIWPLTWAADGHQYTVFGDGGGFGGTGRDGRVSLGVARIEGERKGYVGVNVAGGKGAPHPAPFTGKSEGILALGDRLYLWRNGEGSDTAAFEYMRLYRSQDHGATWEDLKVEFSRRNGDFTGADQGFFGLAFCQFGRGHAGARDEFVYIYATEIVDRSHWGIQKPGRISLLRVEKGRLGDRSAYCFFAGLDVRQQPKWASDLTQRQPVWQDTANGTHRIAVSYNEPLRRYLLSTMTVDRLGHAGIFDAPEPWGPWSTVLLQKDTQRWGSKVICFSFANKWLGADGKSFVLVHTKNDSWASVEGEFVLKSPPLPPSPVIAGIDWAPKETITRQARDGDNWPVTWADDDALYTTWGDGTGFTPKVEQKLSLGFARVTGAPGQISGTNVRSTSEQLGQGRDGKKGWGMISVDGVLYLWLGHADNKGGMTQLAWSKDHAKTWTFADWKFPEFGMMGFVNFGKDHAGARDGFVYAYSHDGSQADTPADSFVLLRAPKDKLTSRAAWEFFVKTGADSQPHWSSNIQERGAVFLHPDACLRSAMTWCAPLKRYLWWQHLPQPPGLTKDRGDTRYSGGFAIYDAPEPWGPWTTAFSTPHWDVGPGEHGDFPTKWMSADGLTLHLVFSGDDAFSVRQAKVRLR